MSTDTTLLATAIIGSVAPTLAVGVAYLSLRAQGRETHLRINSRMDILLELTAKVARAEGVQEKAP